MKRLLAIALHPFVYYQFRKCQEQMVLLYATCAFLRIEEPSVWDVDRIHDMLNEVLATLKSNPHILDGNELVKGHLFWTRLLLRFKSLTISREEVKNILEKYDFTVKNLKKEKPGAFDVVVIHVAMVAAFGELI